MNNSPRNSINALGVGILNVSSAKLDGQKWENRQHGTYNRMRWSLWKIVSRIPVSILAWSEPLETCLFGFLLDLGSLILSWSESFENRWFQSPMPIHTSPERMVRPSTSPTRNKKKKREIHLAETICSNQYQITRELYFENRHDWQEKHKVRDQITKCLNYVS